MDPHTGELLTATQVFDNNDIGLTDFDADEGLMIFTVSGDTMTLKVDEDRNSSIEFNITFKRDNK